QQVASALRQCPPARSGLLRLSLRVGCTMQTPERAQPGWDEPGRNAVEELAIVEPLCAVFRRRLEAEGLKYTPERAQILDAIIQMDEVFEAEALLERMKTAGFRVSKATIYRTIRLLADAGII